MFILIYCNPINAIHSYNLKKKYIEKARPELILKNSFPKVQLLRSPNEKVMKI